MVINVMVCVLALHSTVEEFNSNPDRKLLSCLLIKNKSQNYWESRLTYEYKFKKNVYVNLHFSPTHINTYLIWCIIEKVCADE
jgi:hypothetical protein